jgi:hypothetical protein
MKPRTASIRERTRHDGQGAWCALAIVALLPLLPAAEDPLRDQLDVLERIRCLECETRTDYRIPGEPARSELIRYVVKGEKFSVSYLGIAPDGQPHPAATFAFNGRMWQYLNVASGAMQVVPVRARGDAHLLPWCPGVESPPALQLFSFLHYSDHVPDERMLFSLDALQDRAWVERRLATSVQRIVPGADGSTTLIVLFQKAPQPQAHPVEEGITDEIRLIVRPRPEFGGLRLISDVDAGTAGQPASLHMLVSYRSIACADGSGTIPFPIGLRTPGAEHPEIHTEYTRIIINGVVDDGEFDVDPSKASSISEPFSGGLIKAGD